MGKPLTSLAEASPPGPAAVSSAAGMDLHRTNHEDFAWLREAADVLTTPHHTRFATAFSTREMISLISAPKGPVLGSEVFEIPAAAGPRRVGRRAGQLVAASASAIAETILGRRAK